MQSIQVDMFATFDDVVMNQATDRQAALCINKGLEEVLYKSSEPQGVVSKALKARKLLSSINGQQAGVEKVASINDEIDAEDEWIQFDMFATEWTDEDILKIMDGMLVETLKAFSDDKCSLETIQDAFEWIMSEDILPFSFLVCCKASGLDPDEVRSGVMYCIKKTAFTSKKIPDDVY